MVLFVRAQIDNTVVRHKLLLRQSPSSWHRPDAELAILDARGEEAVIFELQGSLFFGNTYRLYSDLEKEIGSRSYVIIDMRRVPSIDVTAAHLFKLIRDAIRERGATLVLSGIQDDRGEGRHLQELLGLSGVWHAHSKTVRQFADLDAAIEGAMASKYRNSGQTCVCTNRFYVHEAVYDAFAQKLAAAVGQLKVGRGTEPGVTQGPLINAAGLDDAATAMGGYRDAVTQFGNAQAASEQALQRTRLALAPGAERKKMRGFSIQIFQLVT